MSEHEKLYGYSHDLNDSKRIRIAKALIETAEAARNK